MSQPYQHYWEVGEAWLLSHGVDAVRQGGNDRRRVANRYCENWLKDRGLRLGPDYRVDFKLIKGWISDPRNYGITLTIMDPTVALLFKLTWGGAREA